MGGFLYFIPGGSRSIGLEELAGLGLGYAFEMQPDVIGVQHGPENLSGVIVGEGRRFQKFGFYQNEQTWRRIPRPESTGNPCWCGFFNDARPGPADLARARQLHGADLMLGDGQSWRCPIVAVWLDQGESAGHAVALPHSRSIDESGRWAPGAVLAKYAPLLAAAQKFWDAYRGAETVETTSGQVLRRFDDQDLYSSAALMLSANYRIGPAEASMLELLNDLSAAEIMQTAIDFSTYLDWLKKKAAELNHVQPGG